MALGSIQEVYDFSERLDDLANSIDFKINNDLKNKIISNDDARNLGSKSLSLRQVSQELRIDIINKIFNDLIRPQEKLIDLTKRADIKIKDVEKISTVIDFIASLLLLAQAVSSKNIKSILTVWEAIEKNLTDDDENDDAITKIGEHVGSLRRTRLDDRNSFVIKNDAYAVVNKLHMQPLRNLLSDVNRFDLSDKDLLASDAYYIDPVEGIVNFFEREAITNARYERNVNSSEDITESPVLQEEWSDYISRNAFDLIIHYEVTSRKTYEGKLKKPIWPKGASGITIGIGYDLGYVTFDQFINDWGSQLSNEIIQRLKVAVGVKGDHSKEFLEKFSDISIGWNEALFVFSHGVLLNYIQKALRALPNLDKLPDHCIGALVSLTYNRGDGGYSSQKDRYKEMCNIKEHLSTGRIHEIPNEIRTMKRLWVDMPGLIRRREDEAKLFELGLSMMRNLYFAHLHQLVFED
ncbi:MAG: hypothetical protein BWK73_39800 [Thiothrix lacustris]|uniref:Uncharacterized protein n=1 Tax=Thiothrix lacustris TaxID=525917 RepID=A0A1Y1QDP5_9GAMM|nr:MAG: hypothetical protein BWK73_39800 [Thiothrix lacustris]